MTIRHLITTALSVTALFAATEFAIGADMPVKGAPRSYSAPYNPAYNWSGFYLGLNGGYAKGTTDFGIAGASIDTSGYLIGGQIGYNWQPGNWVFGVEADLDWAGIDGSETGVSGVLTATVDSKVKYLGSARVRAGYAWDHWLPYLTAGVGYAKNEVSVSATVPGFTASISDEQGHIGWVAGAGLEWAYSSRWTAKLEYLYYSLGSATYFENVGGGLDTDVKIQTIKVGVNYRF